MTKGLIEKQLSAFRIGNQIFHLLVGQVIVECCLKIHQKPHLCHFLDLQQAFDRINIEALWQALMIMILVIGL